MTFRTSLPRPSGCRDILNLKEPFQIALSTETEWAVVWTKRPAVVHLRCQPTCKTESTHSCGGGNLMVGNSTTPVLTCLSEVWGFALLACHPPPKCRPLACLQQDHLPIVLVDISNAAALDGVDLNVVCLETLAKSSTLTTLSVFLGFRQHQRL